MGDMGTIFFLSSVDDVMIDVVQSTVSIGPMLSNSSGGGGKSVGGGGNSRSARVGGTEREGLPPRNELWGTLKVRRLDLMLSVLFLVKFLFLVNFEDVGELGG